MRIFASIASWHFISVALQTPAKKKKCIRQYFYHFSDIIYAPATRHTTSKKALRGSLVINTKYLSRQKQRQATTNTSKRNTKKIEGKYEGNRSSR